MGPRLRIACQGAATNQSTVGVLTSAKSGIKSATRDEQRSEESVGGERAHCYVKRETMVEVGSSGQE